MKDVYKHQDTSEIMPLVDEAYNKPPFCNPESDVEYPADLIKTYTPEEFAAPDVLRFEASRLYEMEKQRYFWGEKKTIEGPSLDLRETNGVLGLRHHVLVHAATGLVRWGTSDTPSIPYWDREAFVVGTHLQHGEEEGELRVEAADALNINYLRTFTAFLLTRSQEVSQDTATLSNALLKGQRTRTDIRAQQEEELSFLERERTVFTKLSSAKIKHLLWLVDQQKDPEVRKTLLPELTALVDNAAAGISEENLTINMGVDTGISEDTYRPAYVITDFKQLAHLGTDTYSLPQKDCHTLELEEVLKSIDRNDQSKPFYEDGRYQLPWKVTD